MDTSAACSNCITTYLGEYYKIPTACLTCAGPMLEIGHAACKPTCEANIPNVEPCKDCLWQYVGTGCGWVDCLGDPPGGCTPDCSGLECGDDGCGGSCGTCGVDEICNAGICEPPLPGECQTDADCNPGEYCGGQYCYVMVDQHGLTGNYQSGAGGGPWPDGSPDSWDDDGDCYCETLPCHGSVSASCPVLYGGDCDDTVTGYSNNPGVSDWPFDFFDNDCDGQVACDSQTQCLPTQTCSGGFCM